MDTDAVQALLTRWYTIREYAQGKDGVTYDANTYMVRVQLADKEGQGTLIVDSIQFFAATRDPAGQQRCRVQQLLRQPRALI